MKIVLISVFPPYRGGISTHSSILYKHLIKNNDVRVINYSKQYPDILFPGKDQFDNSKSNLDRYKRLYETNNASLSDYENAKSSYSNAESNFKSAKRALQLQKSQIEYTEIIAPMDGIISEVSAEVNEFAQAGAPIMVMSSLISDLEVELGMPENFINKIKNGQHVKVSFLKPEEVVFDGVVTEVGYTTSSFSTFPVVVKILEPSKEVRPGMSCEVVFQFQTSSSKEEQTVPVKSVGEDQEGNFVYLLKEEGTYYVVEKRYVKLGSLTSFGFTITGDSIPNKTKVAVAGLRSLYEGKKVSLLKD